MPKFFFLFILIFLSLPGLCQEETVKEALSENGGQVTIRKSPDVSPTHSASPQALNPNEDSDIREIENARQKNLEKMKLVETAAKPLADPVLNPIEEMQRLGHKQLDAAALMDAKVLAIMQKTLRAGLLNKLPAEEVRKMILEKVKGSHLEGVLSRFPKLLEFCVEMVRDKEALSGLMGIMMRKDDMKTYGYMWLGIFLFGLFLKYRIIKPKWPFFKRFRYSMSVNAVLSIISLYVFYSFFAKELAPTMSIISKLIQA
jgi:hypothetical protein